MFALKFIYHIFNRWFSKRGRERAWLVRDQTMKKGSRTILGGVAKQAIVDAFRRSEIEDEENDATGNSEGA